MLYYYPQGDTMPRTMPRPYRINRSRRTYQSSYSDPSPSPHHFNSIDFLSLLIIVLIVFFVAKFIIKKTRERKSEGAKQMNLKKGFFRLTMMISIIFGFVVLLQITEGFSELPGSFSMWVGPPVCFGLPWLIYFVIYFIIKGFKSAS